MNIVEQLNGAASKVRQNVHAYRQSAVEKARKGVNQAAQAVAATRTPVDTLVTATQRLNDLTHGAFAQLVRQNGATLDGLISGGVARLKDLAQAEDLKSFIRKQAELNPAIRERVSRDFEQFWSIAAQTGRDLGTLASETYAELLYGVPTRAKPAGHRKATRRSTKKKLRTRKAH
jgi:phasin family protein